MDLDDASNLEDGGSATTTTPTTLGPHDAQALRHLHRSYRYSVGDRDVETPFPLNEAQAESMQEGALRPATSPDAMAVRGISQALIGGRTGSRGWGRTAALAPVAEGLAQYLEWHAGARDRPDIGRVVLESAMPLPMGLETPGTQKTPAPEGEYTEKEQHEAYKQARRALEDMIRRKKEEKGISTDPVWEDVLGEHYRRDTPYTPEDDPLDLILARERKPPKGYQRGEDPSLPPIGSYRDPTRNKNVPVPETHEEPIEAEWEPIPDDEHDYEDWPKEQEARDAEPDTGPIAHDPIDENYVPLPYTPSERSWRWTQRMAPFRKGGPFARGVRAGGLAVARGAGAGPAETQPGMNPQFLRRVDAELEARAKGDYAFSIFQPFTTRELEQMRDVQIK